MSIGNAITSLHLLGLENQTAEKLLDHKQWERIVLEAMYRHLHKLYDPNNKKYYSTQEIGSMLIELVRAGEQLTRIEEKGHILSALTAISQTNRNLLGLNIQSVSQEIEKRTERIKTVVDAFRIIDPKNITHPNSMSKLRIGEYELLMSIATLSDNGWVDFLKDAKDHFAKVFQDKITIEKKNDHVDREDREKIWNAISLLEKTTQGERQLALNSIGVDLLMQTEPTTIASFQQATQETTQRGFLASAVGLARKAVEVVREAFTLRR